MLQIPILDWTLADIMLYFQNDWILAWVLILSGGLLAIWLLENITDPIPLIGTLFDGLVLIGTYIGFFVGILDIFVGYVVWTMQPGAVIVAGVLILMGFSLVMRVLSKFPLALVFALALAVFGAATMYGFVQPLTNDATLMSITYVADIINFLISGKGLLIIGGIIFVFVYVISGLIFKLLELLGKVFASTPISVIVGLAAIAVGVVVIFAPDLLGLVAWPTP
ncbi:hypothetical protein EU527_03760 [Candidatus Thorarchaeota archaeon]|nr:MAG: hypothetical protein EU527_03760 [Candidatus Thorarchaeota archaeon]